VWDLGGKAKEGLGLSVAAMGCGALFAAGLAVSQMAMRAKVRQEKTINVCIYICIYIMFVCMRVDKDEKVIQKYLYVNA
jgi:hypothetical protein